MYLLVPFVYFLSWKSCHSLGQAMSETAAWCVGYLATVGIVLAFGIWHINLVSLAPDSPGSAVALVGGFAGMGISRWLWKRRGGHLRRRQPIPWVRLLGRSVQAMRGSRPRPSPGATTTSGPTTPSATPPARPLVTTADVQKAMSSTWLQASVRAIGAMNASRSRSTTTDSSAGLTSTAPPIADPVPPASGPAITAADIHKAMSNKWVRGSVRAIGAMLDNSNSGKRPRG